MPARAAVCAFEICVPGQPPVLGVVKEKTRAAGEYSAAVEDGALSGLAQMVTDDDNDSPDQVRFQLPVSIALRYGAVPPSMFGAVSADAPLHIRAKVVTSDGEQTQVTSPTHAIVAVESNKSKSDKRLSWRSSDSGMDAPRCFAERDACIASHSTVAFQLTMVPKFDVPPMPQQEYLFLIDRSGSMEDQKISVAKRTLTVLLRSLPSSGTTFNIFSFGTVCDSLWFPSRQYDQQSLQEATRHVEAMAADYGGTEICSATQRVLKSRNKSIPTAVFILTDGEAYDINPVVSLVSNEVRTSSKDAHLRVFTLGIGPTASSAMCEGIARAGNGICLMATSMEDITKKCALLVRAGKSGRVDSISVDWGMEAQLDTVGMKDEKTIVKQTLSSTAVQQSPTKIEAIYPGSRFVVFAILGTEKMPHNVTLRAIFHNGEERTVIVPVQSLDLARRNTNSRYVHTLAAHHLMANLAAKRAPAPDAGEIGMTDRVCTTAIVRLGVLYQVVSQHTSFVAVETPRQQLQRAGYIRHGLDRVDRVLSTMDCCNSRDAHPTEWTEESPPSRTSFNDDEKTLWSEGGYQSGMSTMVAHDYDPSIELDQYDGRRNMGSRSVQDLVLASSQQSLCHPPGREDYHLQLFVQSKNFDSYDPTIELDEYGSQEEYGIMGGTRSRPGFLPTIPVPSPRPRGIPSSAFMQSKNFDSYDAEMPEDVVQLIKLQSFDGSFIMNDDLRQIVGEQAAAEGARMDVDDTIWAMVLAVALLELRLTRQKELLDVLLEKVMESISKQVKKDVFDQHVSRAKALISSVSS
ncbi:hypothetical protein EW146_g8832 [Bondarzewia mesenterica]|uniref:VWFA domain-containing protein n=1 Tax=Bondarzewia mesenterica TaxID=1095465 RepID=A0A4S4LD19_9AGAM|nr:hypothetical protein EW146_g8832 [Bondarzewia mesenterica]